MRALRYHHGPEWVELVELPEPELGPGEVLVEVEASPISPMDRLAVRGLYPRRSGPPDSGSEIAGTQGVGRILEIGDEVETIEGLELGRDVLLPARCGPWRERLSVAASALVPLPPDRSPFECCTLRIEGLTAAALLAELEPGDWFIHSPGAGSVGRYLTALAGSSELHSIALVGSREPIADLWGLGADNVLVREEGLRARLIELGLPTPKVAFDGSGGSASELLASCLDTGGWLWVYGATSRMPIQLSVEHLIFRDVRVRGFWLREWVESQGWERARAQLTRLAELGLREQVVATYPLERWREAFAAAEATGARGRVVFTPAAE